MSIFNSKLKYSVVLAVFVAVTLVIGTGSTHVYAESSPTPNTQPSSQNFCSLLSAKNSAIDKKYSDSVTAHEKKINDGRTARDKQHEIVSKTIDNGRDDFDKKQEDNFGRLKAKAKTPAQKTAVENYVKAVKAAILARRTAYNKALSDYNTGVNLAVKNQRDTNDQALVTLRNEIAAAFATAKADCAKTGANPETISKQFRASVKDAQAKFRAKVDTTNFRKKMKELAAKFHADRDAANVAFKEAMKKAKADLDAAFNNSKPE